MVDSCIQGVVDGSSGVQDSLGAGSLLFDVFFYPSSPIQSPYLGVKCDLLFGLHVIFWC